MGKKKPVQLSAEQLAELKKYCQKEKSHNFRKRCQMILLKTEKRIFAEAAKIFGGCEIISSRLTRFAGERFKGFGNSLRVQAITDFETVELSIKIRV